jgi:hypothetical protein
VSEKVLGIINVFRTIFFGRGTVLEELYLTADMVIVARIGGGSLLIWPLATWFRAGKKEEKLAEFSVGELLKADKNNFAIFNSEIRKVELKKHGLGAEINIITNEKKYEWYVRGIPGKKNAKIEDYEKILELVFPDKLSVSK